MLLRVLSVHDAREWLLPVPDGAQEIQVAHVKRLVRVEQQQAAPRDAAREGEAFVVFRGRLLADMDFIDLNALAATDFFVFAEEEPPLDDSEPDDDEQEKKVAAEEEDEHTPHSRKRKRKREELQELDAHVEQLTAMGFVAAQARVAVRQSGGDLAAAIALLTGDASAAALASRNPTSVTRTHPELSVLSPAIDELEALDVRAQAATDSFQAIVRLKEFVADEALAQLTAHPCETVRYFRLPRPPVPPPTASSSSNNDDESAALHGRATTGATRLSPPATRITDAEDDADVIDRVRLYGCVCVLVVVDQRLSEPTHPTFLSMATSAARVHWL